MSKRIEMIEGSSIDKDVIRQVKDRVMGQKKLWFFLIVIIHMIMF